MEKQPCWGPGCLEQRGGTGSDGEGAQSPQMSPDQRRAEAGRVSRVLTVNTEPPEVISPPCRPLQVESKGLQVKTGPRPPTRL